MLHLRFSALVHMFSVGVILLQQQRERATSSATNTLAVVIVCRSFNRVFVLCPQSRSPRRLMSECQITKSLVSFTLLLQHSTNSQTCFNYPHPQLVQTSSKIQEQQNLQIHHFNTIWPRLVSVLERLIPVEKRTANTAAQRCATLSRVGRSCSSKKTRRTRTDLHKAAQS